MTFKQQKEEGKKGARGSVGGRNKQKQPVARQDIQFSRVAI
jgi:hypothetical protein